MRIKNIAFVGIPVTDMKRAREFYEDVLGLNVSDEMMGGKWIEYSAGEATLALANVGEQWMPSGEGTAAAFEVENFDEAISSLDSKVFRSPQSPLERPVVTWRWCKIRTETSS
jgi:predicted enzyme related to lactoylglutathione lyase